MYLAEFKYLFWNERGGIVRLQQKVSLSLICDLLEDILRGECIDAVLRVLLLPVKFSAHCVRFSRSGLTVSETRGHATFKDVDYKWLSRVPEIQTQIWLNFQTLLFLN